MNKEQFLHTKKSLLKKMAQDNYSDGMLRKYDWLISHFEHYCEKNGIAEITLSSAADFIKNARPDSPDPEHVFIKRRAPYACYPDGGGIYAVVSRCIKKSGVDIKGRHFGPHALRHSLATNLLSENVPVSGISDILGHASTITTEIYLTTDETHLKELSLEVPADEG